MTTGATRPTAAALQHKLAGEVKRMYDSIPGGVFDNPDAPKFVTEQYKPLTGGDPSNLIQRVTTWLESQGYKVGTQRFTDGTRGETRYDKMTVRTLPGLAPADRAAVLLHEAGHIICDHRNVDPLQRLIYGTGPEEIEAETVAYVVGGLQGLDLDPVSVSYVAGWAQGDATVARIVGAHVLKKALQLSHALDKIGGGDSESRAAHVPSVAA